MSIKRENQKKMRGATEYRESLAPPCLHFLFLSTKVTDFFFTRLGAPKITTGFQGAHKGDARTAPQVATFGSDKTAEAGEFESSAAPSTADTATHRQDRVGSTQAGEFESSASASRADTGTHRQDRVGDLQAGEFESTPAPSHTDTAAARADRVGVSETYE